MANPFDVVRQFERAVAEYTGAPFVVTTTSCTMAILLACAWFYRCGERRGITMPRYSYIGVPQSIIHAGFKVDFRDEHWFGEYRLDPIPVWDSARMFTSGMYRKGQMQCTSHHWSKILGVSQMGCILHDNQMADDWLRRARFDGRTEGVNAKFDRIQDIGWHAYVSPEVAAAGLVRLANLPKHNDPLPWGPGTNSDYPDLSQLECFK